MHKTWQKIFRRFKPLSVVPRTPKIRKKYSVPTHFLRETKRCVRKYCVIVTGRSLRKLRSDQGSFSKLNVKLTCLTSTMGQKWLNDLVLMSIDRKELAANKSYLSLEHRVEKSVADGIQRLFSFSFPSTKTSCSFSPSFICSSPNFPLPQAS